MVNIKLKLKMLIYWCTPFPIVRILLESSKFKYMSLKAIHTTRDRAIDIQSIELFKQLQILVLFFFFNSKDVQWRQNRLIFKTLLSFVRMTELILRIF